MKCGSMIETDFGQGGRVKHCQDSHSRIKSASLDHAGRMNSQLLWEALMGEFEGLILGGHQPAQHLTETLLLILKPKKLCWTTRLIGCLFQVRVMHVAAQSAIYCLY